MSDKYKYKKGKVEFSDIRNTNIRLGQKISRAGYTEDEDGNIVFNPVINAVDIDWNNVKIGENGQPISTSADLLNVIADMRGNSSGGPGGDPDSIPIYDAETESRLSGEGSLPEKYISLGDDHNTANGITLLNQLFSVVTSLQAEVNKLKNTFTRGIYSYNGEATYMSNVVGQYGDDEEPLWAIDESELSEIEEFNYDWENLTEYNDNEILKNIEDNRLFLFTTIAKLNKDEDKNFIITFNDASDEGTSIEINLADYVTTNYECNVMVLISRKPSNKEYPNNFIYITVTDWHDNHTIKLGYLSSALTLEHDEQPLSKNYYFKKVDYTGNELSKFNIYSQNRTFGNEVLAAVPDEEDDSYRVAHIAVRSVKNYSVIEKISKQLVNNEFIIDEAEEALYLKINNKIIKIGEPSEGGGNTPVEPDIPWPDDTTMTNQEIIKALESQGIITVTFVNPNLIEDDDKYAPSNIISYRYNDIGSVRFIHEETGNVYEYKTNAYGELESKLIKDSTTFAEILRNITVSDDFKSVRGLIGQIGEKQAGLAASADHGLNADRIRIGAIYAPLSTDVTFGCSHAYVELENTSDKDFNLVGCQLHFIKPEYSSILNKEIFTKRTIELTGTLPAGSTYLIRGKKYIKNDNDSNCYIHVDTYDQEWYDNGELIDFTMKTSDPSYVFILSYHGKVSTNSGNKDFLTSKDTLYNLGSELTTETITSSSLMTYLGDNVTNRGSMAVCKTNPKNFVDDTNNNSPLVYAKGFIDGLCFGTSTRYGIISAYTYTSNCLYKGTYELDPAKQAFNGFTKRDSSRHRWEKKGNDYQYIKLEKNAIEFPKSTTTRLVEYFTPKASFEHKNVISDKTKFDHEKPNAVSVSYGENVYTTRCFNWVSASNLNEYVWIYDESNNLVGKFESYKTRSLTENVTTTKVDRTSLESILNGYSKNTTFKFNNNAWTCTETSTIDVNLNYNNANIYVERQDDGWYSGQKLNLYVVEKLMSCPANATRSYNSSNNTWEFRYTDSTEHVITLQKSDFTHIANKVSVETYDADFDLANIRFENTSNIWYSYNIDTFDRIENDNLPDSSNGVTYKITYSNSVCKCTFTYISKQTTYDNADSSLKFEYVDNIWYSYKEQQTKTYTDDVYNSYMSSSTYPRRKEFPYDINNIAYCDYREAQVIDRDNKNKDVTYAEYAKAPRCCGLFAGSNEFFTSHKCVVEIVSTPVNVKKKYSYIVGQSDKNGNPIMDHSSEKRYFTLYPDSYRPVIYQITDQQGFHWIEYQVWAAAAIKLNEKIEADIIAAENAGDPIMPIIINTGDMTQSGSRVNEWLDYYIGGETLFNHFEQNNLVGNNDLNGTDIQTLGTGDDPGKSNPYYYYVFNCNEVNNFFTDGETKHYPIVNKVYIPSLYYIDCKDIRIMLINSEITPINCRDWYNLRCDSEGTNNEYTVNIYTGYTMRGDGTKAPNSIIEKYVADNADILGDKTFTPIYTLLYHAFNDTSKRCIAACHEMPYTVVTQACCAEGEQITRFRSISDAASGKLIGSHLNQMQPTEDGAGVYWFSRLLESSGVKLCIGGHKHTYALTYPVRENYKYYDGDTLKTSKFDGPMVMGETLKNEARTSINDAKVIWSWKPELTGENNRGEYQWYKNSQTPANNYSGTINWSKLPLTYRDSNFILPADGTFYPATVVTEDDGYKDKAVTYIMCQATGYKLTSNKELPTPNQKFSRIIPKTSNGDNNTDTPNNNQKYPMYIKYDIFNEDGSIQCNAYLARATNIFKNYKFDMSTYNTKNIEWQYLIDKKLHKAENHVITVGEYSSSETMTTSQYEAGHFDSLYDNYGLWVKEESQILETIVL